MKKVFKEPRFGGGIVCDLAKPNASGKMDAIGIFTRFWAWGYPANRNWSLILNIFYLPKEETTLHIGIRKSGIEKINEIATASIHDKISDNPQTINVPIIYSFESDGDFEIVCTLKNFKTELFLPFNVRTKEWPIFDEKELEFLEKNKESIPYKFGAQIKCKKCGHLYNFEEIILPSEKVSGGALRFPESGEFFCENCGSILYLKDIQGQIRASIKDNLVNAINKHRHV